MKNLAIIVLVTALVLCTGCKPKVSPPAEPGKPAVPEAGQGDSQTPDQKPPDQPASPAVKTTAVQSVVVKQKITRPRALWTGEGVQLVWLQYEVEEDDQEIEGANLDGVSAFSMHTAAVDGTTGAIAEAVALPAAGDGPAALSGPSFSEPRWFDGTVAIAWALWNEDAGALRYVLGRWKPDGSLVADPVILDKDSFHHATEEGDDVRLVAAGDALFASWMTEAPAKKTGCTGEHGSTDSVAIASLGKEGVVSLDWICADVMLGYEIHRFGENAFWATYNEHIGDHTWMGCVPGGTGCGSEYYSAVNPLTDLLMTGGAVAVWSDELDQEDYEVVGHCLDVYPAQGVKNAGPAVECARPKGRTLVWGDHGLGVLLTDKKGGEYFLPYLPGDSVHMDLLKPRLVEKSPAVQALWTGSSIVLVWSRGKTLKTRILGRDGLVFD